jgi:hypothetical protein
MEKWETQGIKSVDFFKSFLPTIPVFQYSIINRSLR